MILMGDVAYPDSDIVFQPLPNSDICLFNFEGYAVRSQEGSDNGVFNNIEAVEKFPFDKLIGIIANNHIADIPDGVSQTIELAKNTRIRLVGGAENIEAASKPLLVNYLNHEVAIIAAGWNVIGCKQATKNNPGVLPLNFANIIAEIKNQKSLGRKVVLYVHWGYELERYPHPSHRMYALKCVDAGVDLIVGCHAHCIQGFETYKNTKIFYGIGNAVFKQNHYFGGRLKFPEYCSKGLCISWDIDTNDILVAEITLQEAEVKVGDFISTENHAELIGLSNFSGYTHREYTDYFRVNRVKKKGLPVFHEYENTIMFKLKQRFVIFRSVIISLAFRLNLLKY